jgi:cell division protein FtsB
LSNAYTVRRPVVNAYLVRERDRRRVRELALVLAAVFPLGLGLLAYTWQQVETLRLGYRIEALERRAHDLAQVERQLRLEAAYLANPARLSERAEEELGLAAPRVDQILFSDEVGPGKSGESTPGAGAAR